MTTRRSLVRGLAASSLVLGMVAAGACSSGADGTTIETVEGAGGASGTTSSTGSGGATATTTTTGSGGAGTGGAPVCAKGSFRCVGDALEACADDGSGYHNVITCPAGLCDAALGACDACAAGATRCSGPKTIAVCAADRQGEDKTTCPAEAPYCRTLDGVAACVACADDGDCAGVSTACVTGVCGAGGACEAIPVAAGQPCGPKGDGGACDGAGACRFCEGGEVRCAADVPEACDGAGQWVAQPPCAGAKPVCLDGACFECAGAAECPASKNDCLVAACSDAHACGFDPLPAGTACGAGGTCDGKGQCNLCAPGTGTCNGKVPLLCGADGKYAEQPACASACDPATGACVACLAPKDCPAPASDCLYATCAAMTCGTAPLPQGSACAGGGQCNGGGLCFLCSPGLAKCVGDAVATCSDQGQWGAPAACAAPKPFCDAGTSKCVACKSAADCPAPADPCLVAACSASTCGTAPAKAGTACAGGTCDGAGKCAVADAGASDAGASDAGASDAGASDAGASDAGASDAGGVCALGHLVVSEIRSRGAGGASDELVELYNPTNAPVTLDATWKLESRSTASATYTARWTGKGATIPAYGHFLIVGTAYAQSPAKDDALSSGITDSASLVLRHDGVVVDAVCYYFAPAQLALFDATYVCEGTPVSNLPHNDTTAAGSNADVSIERKPGGAAGNCTDTGDSAADFVTSTPSTPLSSASQPTP